MADLMQSIQDMLKEETWTRATISNYTQNNLKELAELVEKAKSEGIIKEVYPYIFMLEITDKDDENKMISYSYSDLLTNDVQMTLCS